MNRMTIAILLLVLAISLTGVGAGAWYANGETIGTSSKWYIPIPANKTAQGFGIGIGVTGLGMTITGLVLLGRKD